MPSGPYENQLGASVETRQRKDDGLASGAARDLSQCQGRLSPNYADAGKAFDEEIPVEIIFVEQNLPRRLFLETVTFSN